ncbi:hypothetical protein LMG31506_04311 [Cupriavidus yeoncheonensis]|uniref:Uncharacterized protein n=1 Tax=Cupriavidus yeoncheonensis TaxID=1462994 RepID=A0A916IYD7_9BURK|nr:hypothetical protein [Cupriavidus yeoncheonensis]CAG2150865.1 hypothetical protein LMG31506_04311 [Cupriavidus yeoncheonensis]
MNLTHFKRILLVAMIAAGYWPALQASGHPLRDGSMSCVRADNSYCKAGKADRNAMDRGK